MGFPCTFASKVTKPDSNAADIGEGLWYYNYIENPLRFPDPTRMETLEKNEPELARKFEELFREKSEKEGQPPRRGAHTVSLGLLKGEFIIEPGLPEELKVGLFKQAVTYPALVRTSSARIEGGSNTVKDGRGFAIKLIGVPGEKCTPDLRFRQTQDFILLSIPVSAMGTLKGFLNFMNDYLRLPLALFLLKGLFNGHLSKFIRVARNYRHDTSPLDIRYWSLTPYLFGDRAVKFSVIPTSAYKSAMPAVLTERYLSDNMADHLANHEASFDFMVQFFQDQERTPIESMSREWKESDAPFVKVATIRIPKQDFQTPERYALAEDLSYSPVHALVEHRPLGGINRARNYVYERLWKFRMAARKKEGYEADTDMFQALA